MNKWVNAVLTIMQKPSIMSNDRNIVLEFDSCYMGIIWYACNKTIHQTSFGVKEI